MSSDQVSDMKPPVLADLQAAAMRLAGKAVRTPLLRSPVLDALTGAQVFIKPENLQRQGAFKFRGAYNLIANLPPEARAKGVLAWSSGNHAQGVAMAAQMFGVPPSLSCRKTRRR
jgi:L-threonine ammonia-lyase (EC 4.3.1.19)